MSDRTVRVRLIALTDQFRSQFRGASRDASGLQTSMGQTGRSSRMLNSELGILATRFLGPAGLVAGLKASADTALEVERNLTKLNTLVGLSASEIDDVTAAITSMSDTGQSVVDLSDAMFQITSAGLRGADAMDTLDIAAKGAAIGLGDVNTIADLATSAMNAYGVENLTAASAIDAVGAAVRAGKMDAESLAGAMGTLLPTASSLGITFEDLAGTFAVMSRTGSNASESATSLQAIMSTLLGTSEQGVEALAEMGLSLQDLRDIAAGEGGLVGVMRTLDEAFAGNEEALRKVVPNVRAFRGVMNVLAQDATIVDQVMRDVAQSAGFTEDAFSEWEKTADAAIKQLKAELELFKLEIGNELVPEIAKMTRLFRELLAFELPDWLGGGRALMEFGQGVNRVANPLAMFQWALEGAKSDWDGLMDALGRSTPTFDLATDGLNAGEDALWDFSIAADAVPGPTGDAADAVGGLRDEVDAQAAASERAAEVMQDYLDVMRGARDPVFALNRAFGKAEEALQDYNTAVEISGARSEDAQQAALDYFQALTDLEVAALDTALSFEQFEAQLQEQVRTGRMSEQMAKDILAALRPLMTEVDRFQGDRTLRLHIDTQGAWAAIHDLQRGITSIQPVGADDVRIRAGSGTGGQLMMHSGGVVSGSAGWMPGLASDERVRILQLGETVVPNGSSDVAALASAFTSSMGTGQTPGLTVHQTFVADVSRATVSEAAHAARLEYARMR